LIGPGARSIRSTRAHQADECAHRLCRGAFVVHAFA
jgi:hypothetical protein